MLTSLEAHWTILEAELLEVRRNPTQYITRAATACFGGCLLACFSVLLEAAAYSRTFAHFQSSGFDCAAVCLRLPPLPTDQSRHGELRAVRTKIRGLFYTTPSIPEGKSPRAQLRNLSRLLLRQELKYMKKNKMKDIVKSMEVPLVSPSGPKHS